MQNTTLPSIPAAHLYQIGSAPVDPRRPEEGHWVYYALPSRYGRHGKVTYWCGDTSSNLLQRTWLPCQPWHKIEPDAVKAA